MNVFNMENKGIKKGYTQIAQGVFGTKVVEEEKSIGSTSPSSGANRPTIGSTMISTHEVEVIREEVRKTMAEFFQEFK